MAKGLCGLWRAASPQFPAPSVFRTSACFLPSLIRRVRALSAINPTDEIGARCQLKMMKPAESSAPSAIPPSLLRFPLSLLSVSRSAAGRRFAGAASPVHPYSRAAITRIKANRCVEDARAPRPSPLRRIMSLRSSQRW